MKRFWTRASVAESGDGGFTLALDGRPLRLPGSGGVLRLPSRILAEALAEEWQEAGGAPGGEMSMESVPLTRVVGTALERMAPNPAPSVAALAKYAETDLLCYRAEERALATRQAEAWQPLLDWAEARFAAPLVVTRGVMPVAQPAESLAALDRAVAALPVLELAALGLAAPALGSLVLGLAMAHGRLDAAGACRLAFLDETFQAEFWGEDAEALARRLRVEDDVALAERLFALAKG